MGDGARQYSKGCNNVVSGAGTSDGAALPDRDALVAQLLEERRHRLQWRLTGANTASETQCAGFSCEPWSPQRLTSAIGGEKTHCASSLTAWREAAALTPRKVPDAHQVANSTTATRTPDDFSFGCWEDVSRGSPTTSVSPPVSEYRNAVDSVQAVVPGSRPGQRGAESTQTSPPVRGGQGSRLRAQSAPSGGAPLRAGWGQGRGHVLSPGDPGAGLSLHAPAAANGSAAEAKTTMAREQRWAARRSAVQERQERTRLEQERQEMDECTFHPAISSKSAMYANRARGCCTQPLIERLHQEAGQRSALREKAKELVEAEECFSHPFKPIIMRGDRTPKQVPIHMRADTVRKQQQERLRKKQQACDDAAVCSFQPKISGRSRRLAQGRVFARSASEGAVAAGPVEERLYAEAGEMRRRQTQRTTDAEGPSPKPDMDIGSKRICMSSVYCTGPQQDFLIRQDTFEAARQQRRQVRERHGEESTCPFAPRIAGKSRLMVASHIDFVRGTPDETTERLAVRDVGCREQRMRKRIQATDQEGCTFAPKVDPLSRQIVRAASACGAPQQAAHDRLHQGAAERRSSAGAGPEDSVAECTFKPRVSPGTARMFPHVRSRYAGSGEQVTANVQSELGEREQNTATLRRAREEQMAAECTFAPSVRKAVVRSTDAFVVSGLGRFFELKALASRQHEEERQREQQAFKCNFEEERCGGITIPVPFGLSRDQRPAQRECLV